MTKKQLRQRIKDISAGAHLNWIEEDEYWDNMSPEILSNFIEGLVTALGIPRDSYLVHFVNLDQYESLDALTDFIFKGLDRELRGE